MRPLQVTTGLGFLLSDLVFVLGNHCLETQNGKEFPLLQHRNLLNKLLKSVRVDVFSVEPQFPLPFKEGEELESKGLSSVLLMARDPGVAMLQGGLKSVKPARKLLPYDSTTLWCLYLQIFNILASF